LEVLLMPSLDFSVESAAAVTFAASPNLSFKLRIRNANANERIQSIALRCQIQIEPVKRKYSTNEQSQLFELYGEPERWGRTLRSMLWTHTSAMVPPFQGETVVDLPVPCTFDFNIGATKYFAGLDDGVVPLMLMFSGTIFLEHEGQGLQVEQIPWDKEAPFRLPISIWRQMMDHYYPNTAWLCLRRDVFEQLAHYKMEHAIPTWDQTLERLVSHAAALNQRALQDKRAAGEDARGSSTMVDEQPIEGSLPS
jgi:Family of unknown function (DUF6084)